MEDEIYRFVQGFWQLNGNLLKYVGLIAVISQSNVHAMEKSIGISSPA